ncbi:decaprenyl-phosphate phosphoribosyltransferase [bacterium]|nr:decaprenyl-phosphate phosphoribosyltransferase [bacterium]
MIGSIIVTMRPRQWTKNVLLFAGIVFSLHVFDPVMLGKVFLGFIIFCALSGSIYILNDLVDIEKDRLHPKKSQRPIASGQLSPNIARIACILVLLCSLIVSSTLGILFLLICLIYLLMNIAYSFYLKRVVIIDVMVVATGFVLRAVAGAVIIKVAISPWLLICTFFLALFLAFCKRRSELLSLEENGQNFRDVLVQYTPEVLDQMIAVVTASSLMAYSFYTVSESVAQKFHTDYLFLTIPFVLFGIFRYLFLVHTKNMGGSPELILLTDIPLIINILCYSITVFLILYLRI